jgi:hypothetical protein
LFLTNFSTDKRDTRAALQLHRREKPKILPKDAVSWGTGSDDEAVAQFRPDTPLSQEALLRQVFVFTIKSVKPIQ